MKKRLITIRQEQILKLVHHDFKGLSQSEAARKLGITQSAISDALKQVKKIMPQFFPLLTKIEAERYHLYCIEGWPVNEIAEHSGLTPDSVYKALQRARDKGARFAEPKGRALRYDPSMDVNVKYKF